MGTKYRPAHINRHADREGIKIITQNGMAKRNKLRSIVHCLAMCNSSILSARAYMCASGAARSRLQFEITNERKLSKFSPYVYERKSAQERSCTHPRRRCLETIYYNPQGPELLIVGESQLFCVITCLQSLIWCNLRKRCVVSFFAVNWCCSF